MNEQKTREKIIDCMTKVVFYSRYGHEETLPAEEAEKFADALIAEGLTFRGNKHKVFIPKAPIPPADDNTMFFSDAPSKIIQLYDDEKVEQIVKERNKLKQHTKVIEAENAELRARLDKAVELPYSHLEMLKLLTCASICYAEIKKLITARMGKSEDIADLFLKCPTVQGITLDFALYNLAKANLNCNKIRGFEEIINATGTFKDYLAEAEARLAELKGEKE